MKYSRLNKPRASWSKREQAGANQSQDLARAPKAISFLTIFLSKPSIWEPWLPDPDFQDLARALEPGIFLLNSLSKTSIWEPWLPDPDFHDLARALEAIICLLISI